MTTKRILASAVVVLTFALGTAVAQKAKREDTNTRTVQGVVLDGSDNPITGAVVQLKDTKTLQIRSFITQDKGEYHFAGLSTNVDYELKADHGGSSSGSKTLSVFDNRKLATLNLKLK
jgi:Carboxypeptidase regulatory-like domain